MERVPGNWTTPSFLHPRARARERERVDYFISIERTCLNRDSYPN